MIEIPIQMRFADVDMLQHVNNTNLQHYLDIGKTHYINDILKIEDPWHGEGLILAAINTNYLAQTRWGEQLAVRTTVKKIGGKSLILLQQIVNTDTRQIKCECETVMVAFDFRSQESISVPDKWKKLIVAENPDVEGYDSEWKE